MSNARKQLFLLEPSIHYLNHGSFGACPISVFEAYQEWQRRLERQPVAFMGELPALDRQARQALAEYVHTSIDNVVFIPNATYGVNVISRSLQLNPGDEVLTTNHEYGACDYAWEFTCQKTGARYLRQSISLPVNSPEEITEQFWQGVTPRTKVI